MKYFEKYMLSIFITLSRGLENADNDNLSVTKETFIYNAKSYRMQVLKKVLNFITTLLLKCFERIHVIFTKIC